MTGTRNIPGKAMKIRLAGELEHQQPNVLDLFTIDEDHENETNPIVETLNMFLTVVA